MKPILFIDFDGTICHDRFWRSLPKEQYTKVQEFLFESDSAYVNEWMRGKRTSEEINMLVAEHIGMSYEKLWELFVKDCETMQVSLGVLKRIQSLRNKYTVILITVNMDSFMRFTVPALNLNLYFDHISSSYEEKILKTDNKGEIFMKFTDAHEVPIGTCFLIDDSLKVCSTFKYLGGNECLVTGNKNVMYYLDQLI